MTYLDKQDHNPSELRDLFLSVGWTSGKHPEKLARAMEGSSAVITAWDGEKLVGLINCLSDGAMTAYIHYLLVRPEYQGQGTGRTLLRMMLDRYAHCLRKVLIADDEQVGFYKRCGFVVGTGTAALFLDADAELTQDVL